MQTNKQIKRKELFILRNKLIVANKEFKEVQEKFLIALSNCAKSEALNEDKKLQKQALAEFKFQLNQYFIIYRKRFEILLDIEKLQKWEAREPKDYEGKFIEQA